MPIVVNSNKIFQDFLSSPNSEIVINFDPYDYAEESVFDVDNAIFYPVISFYCESVVDCDD